MEPCAAFAWADVVLEDVTSADVEAVVLLWQAVKRRTPDMATSADFTRADLEVRTETRFIF
jgi:hypothetical protein